MEKTYTLSEYARDVALASERYTSVAAYHIKRGENAEALRALKTVTRINNRMAVYSKLQGQ